MIYLQGRDSKVKVRQLNSSDFYWESLEIPNYSTAKIVVSNRLEDFRGFISRAISSLKMFTYSYDFNSYTKLTLETKDLRNLPEDIILCSDKEFSTIVFNGKLAAGQKKTYTTGYPGTFKCIH